jgi:hypothetical protein
MILTLDSQINPLRVQVAHGPLDTTRSQRALLIRHVLQASCSTVSGRAAFSEDLGGGILCVSGFGNQFCPGGGGSGQETGIGGIGEPGALR